MLRLLLLLSASPALADDQGNVAAVSATDLALLREAELTELAPLRTVEERQRAVVAAAEMGVEDAKATIAELRASLQDARGPDRRSLRVRLRTAERVLELREASVDLASARLGVARAELELARLEQLRTHHQVDAYVHGDFLHQLQTARWLVTEAEQAVLEAKERLDQAMAREERVTAP